MTKLNSIKIEACPPDDLVAYLYDEMSPVEKSVFETHLADCDTCTDEFAELSFARLGVYEWHRDEFAAMATPRFVIPQAETEGGVSWLDAVRGFFASHGQWATAGAFALIAVIFGAVFISSMNSTDETAVTPKSADYVADKDQSVNPPSIPPPAKDIPAGTIAAAKPDDEPQIVNVATDGKSSKAARVVNRKPVKTLERGVVGPVLSRNTAPRLNDFVDEDDTTLRLGDLLADVDTKDK